MQKRVKHNKHEQRRSSDVNEIAHQLVDLSTRGPDNGQSPHPPVPKSVSQYMAQIGRRGGQIGGKRRLDTLSATERQKIAQQAAKARWERHDGVEPKN